MSTRGSQRKWSGNLENVRGAVFQGDQIAAGNITNYWNSSGNIEDEDTKRRNRILDTLDFAERKSREHQVKALDTPETTFSWVWDEDEKSCGFAEWLSSSEPLFWICGKPGSGKSTLVSYLVDAEDTVSLLSGSNSEIAWTTFSFYFDFRAGAGLSNSIEGLLRSLLFQLVDEGLVDLASFAGVDDGPRKSRATHLSLPQLQNALEACLPNSPNCLCIFIDGLDEFGGRMLDLIQFLRRITRRHQEQHNILKFVIASRPDGHLENTYAGVPSFRLQDHNSAGIREYITPLLTDFLGEAETTRHLSSALNYPLENHTYPRSSYIVSDRASDHQDSPSPIESLVYGVIKKADGVFLWARFAVYNLIESQADGDSVDEMLTRLKELSPDLKALYANILTRLRSEHRAESWVLLQLTTQMPDDYGFQTITALFAAANFICSGKVDNRGWYPTDIKELEKRLRARTGGILETQDNPEAQDDPEARFAGSHIPKVKLCHETAREFVLSLEEPHHLKHASLIKDSLSLASNLIQIILQGIAINSDDRRLSLSYALGFDEIRTSDGFDNPEWTLDLEKIAPHRCTPLIQYVSSFGDLFRDCHGLNTTSEIPLRVYLKCRLFVCTQRIRIPLLPRYRKTFLADISLSRS